MPPGSRSKAAAAAAFSPSTSTMSSEGAPRAKEIVSGIAFQSTTRAAARRAARVRSQRERRSTVASIGAGRLVMLSIATAARCTAGSFALRAASPARPASPADSARRRRHRGRDDALRAGALANRIQPHVAARSNPRPRRRRPRRSSRRARRRSGPAPRVSPARAAIARLTARWRAAGAGGRCALRPIDEAWSALCTALAAAAALGERRAETVPSAIVTVHCSAAASRRRGPQDDRGADDAVAEIGLGADVRGRPRTRTDANASASRPRSTSSAIRGSSRGATDGPGASSSPPKTSSAVARPAATRTGRRSTR